MFLNRHRYLVGIPGSICFAMAAVLIDQATDSGSDALIDALLVGSWAAAGVYAVTSNGFAGLLTISIFAGLTLVVNEMGRLRQSPPGEAADPFLASGLMSALASTGIVVGLVALGIRHLVGILRRR